MNIFTCTVLHLHFYTCTFLHVHFYMYISTCMFLGVHFYIHFYMTFIRAHVYIYISTCRPTFLLSSLPSAVPTMRLSQDSSRLPFCLFLFGRFTSPGSFWIFFSFRSSLT